MNILLLFRDDRNLANELIDVYKPLLEERGHNIDSSYSLDNKSLGDYDFVLAHLEISDVPKLLAETKRRKEFKVVITTMDWDDYIEERTEQIGFVIPQFHSEKTIDFLAKHYGV